MFSSLKSSSRRRQHPLKVTSMTAAHFLLATAIVFTGCRTVHDAAVTSFHVTAAPANFVRESFYTTQKNTTPTNNTAPPQHRPATPLRPRATTPAPNVPSRHSVRAVRDRPLRRCGRRRRVRLVPPPPPRGAAVNPPCGSRSGSSRRARPSRGGRRHATSRRSGARSPRSVA